MDGQDELYDKLKDIEPNIPISEEPKQPQEPNRPIFQEPDITENAENLEDIEKADK